MFQPKEGTRSFSASVGPPIAGQVTIIPPNRAFLCTERCSTADVRSYSEGVVSHLVYNDGIRVRGISSFPVYGRRPAVGSATLPEKQTGVGESDS